MAVTIATLRDNIKTRLNLDTASGAEATDPMLEAWLADAFRWAITVCPPIFETTVSLNDERTGTLSADDVLYVANAHRLLVPAEWNRRGTTLILNPSAASSGDQVQVWYFLMPAITTTVETTCVFGADWLAELAMLNAMMQAELRQMTVAASDDRDGHATRWRAIQTERDQLLKVMQAQRQTWIGKKEQDIAARVTLGDGVNRESAYVGFVNNSRIINRDTGLAG